MSKKTKIFNAVKEACRIRREQEIAEHGKQVSLRKFRVFSSAKDYKRDKKVDLDE